jgi:hypothetical protein
MTTVDEDRDLDPTEAMQEADLELIDELRALAHSQWRGDPPASWDAFNLVMKRDLAARLLGVAVDAEQTRPVGRDQSRLEASMRDAVIADTIAQREAEVAKASFEQARTDYEWAKIRADEARTALNDAIEAYRKMVPLP